MQFTCIHRSTLLLGSGQVLLSITRCRESLTRRGYSYSRAVLVLAVVMFLVLAATATVVIALGLIRRLFTPDHRLMYLPTPADR